MLNLTSAQWDGVATNSQLIYAIHLHDLKVSSHTFTYDDIQYKPIVLKVSSIQ